MHFPMPELNIQAMRKDFNVKRLEVYPKYLFLYMLEYNPLFK